MHYRREVDGLRSVAVLPVILFHAGFDVFSGGYVGVDVFFVISGYLITSILISDLERGDFSIARFYERRARRILPALFVVMLACLPFAWMWMLPSDLKDFAQSLIAVVFFASNILFQRESGYFAADAELKPLLHTWSLAVEEQYYLIFPVFLLLTWRFGRNRVFWAVAASAALSFVLCEWWWRDSPSAIFYLAPARAWELLAGSLVAFYLQGRAQPSSNALSLAGLALILYAIFAFDETTPFPGVYAVAPVLGSALIILFAGERTLVARLLSVKPLVGIGLISYSAYLWHQPLFAFARIRSVSEPSEALMGALAVAALLLAWATWLFVETPFRRRPAPLLPSRRQVFIASGAAGAVFAAIGVAGHVGQGFHGRFNLDKAFLDHFENSAPAHEFLHRADLFRHYRDECNFFIHDIENYEGVRESVPDSCTVPQDPAKPTILIWGDSHAQHLHPGVEVVAGGRWNLLQVATSGCRPQLLSNPMREICARSNKAALDAVAAARPEIVLIGSIGMWDIAALNGIAAHLQGLGVKTVLVSGPPPHWRPSLPFLLASRDLGLGNRAWRGVDLAYVEYNERLVSAAAEEGSAFAVLDLMSALCDEAGCLTHIGEDRREGITSFDYGHLMPVASRLAAEATLRPFLGGR